MTYPSVETALQSLEQTNDNLVEQVDGIQTRADAAVSQAETIKGETATLKDGTTAIKSETAVIASDAATSKSLAEDARDTTLGYRDETKVHLDNAAAVVTGGTATLEPESGKIPLSDSTGFIDLNWLDTSILRNAVRASANLVWDSVSDDYSREYVTSGVTPIQIGRAHV